MKRKITDDASVRFRVGTEFCYAEFDSEAAAKNYQFRRFPLAYLRSLTPRERGIFCRLGFHTITKYIDGPDGGGGVRVYRFCEKCLRGDARVGHPSVSETIFNTFDAP